MKSAILFYQQLLKDSSANQSEVRNYISRIYVNTDLILFICRALLHFPEQSNRILILLNLKRIIIQTPRLPNPDQYRVNPDFFESIKKEQKLNDPLRFIDAELEFLRAVEASTSNDKEWLTEAEILKQFNFSRGTLRKRIGEGMPCAKIGGKKQFSRALVSNWLAKIANEA